MMGGAALELLALRVTDCLFYRLDRREGYGSGPLGRMEREWCEHPRYSPCARVTSAWHPSPPSGWRNLNCGGKLEKCPLTARQFEDVY